MAYVPGLLMSQCDGYMHDVLMHLYLQSASKAVIKFK